MEAAAESDENEKRWRESLRPLFQRLPARYAELAKEARSIRHAFQAELAATVQESLNNHLRRIPADEQKSYEQKSGLSTWINQELRELGLSILCPSTGTSASLVADWRTNPHLDSRYRFETLDGDRRRSRRLSFQILPDLTLIEAPFRENPLSRSGRQGRR